MLTRQVRRPTAGPTIVMSRDNVHRSPCDIVLLSGRPLVVLGWIEGEGRQELAGVACYAADVQVGDEGQGVGAGVASADADVWSRSIPERAARTWPPPFGSPEGHLRELGFAGCMSPTVRLEMHAGGPGLSRRTRTAPPLPIRGT